MTATSPKASSLPDLATIKAALASTSTCSTAIVAALQDLLGATAKGTAAQDKDHVKPKGGKTAQRTRNASRPRAKTKTVVDVEILEDAGPALAPRDRFLLATSAVNLSLKALGDALKPQLKSHSSTKQDQSTRNASSISSNAPSGSQRPLASRAVSQLTNASTKSPDLQRSSSYSSAKSGAAPGVVAVAECARLAFAYLRTAEAWKTLGKDMPPLQLESGMLSLVGKLLSHGLEALATKELRILKRRLESCMRPSREDGAVAAKEANLKREAEQAAEKETVASLLHFNDLDKQNPAFQLVINHQIYVLKIIASNKRATTIESAYGYLRQSAPSSPVNILSDLAEMSGNKEKAARQLETIALMLLSLCPSISISEDVSACDPKVSPSPDTVFQLQSLAFEARARWWKISGHEGNATRELLEPFSKCLAALSRRSTSADPGKYTLAVEKYKSLGELLNPKASDPFSAETNVCKILSSLAQKAGLGKEAMKWMKTQASSTGNTRISEAALAASRVRIAALSLDSRLSGGQDEEFSVSIEAALVDLGGSLKGDSADLDSLLTEVTALRRAASRAFVDAKDVQGLKQAFLPVIAGCTHFLARYIGTSPAEGADAQTFLRHGERLKFASKAVKGFMDSATACCKILILSESIIWDSLENILQDCCFILDQLESLYRANPRQLQQFASGLQHPFVKISGLYWFFFIHLRKSGATGDSLLQPLRRAVQVLMDRPEEEKVSGLLLLKLEKLGETLEAARRYDDAQVAYKTFLRTQIGSGILQSAADQASIRSLQQVMQENGLAGFLKIIKSSHRLSLRKGQKNHGQGLFYDDEELVHPQRALLLELQLMLCCATYAKTRHPNAALSTSIRDLAKILFELYNVMEYPLRRQRVATYVLCLGVDAQEILDPASSTAATECDVGPDDLFGSDFGLAQYQGHYTASHKTALALLESSPSVEKLQDTLRSWHKIIDNSTSWSHLINHIDDFDSWISQLQMISDFFALRGVDFSRVSALSVMTKALELQQPPDLEKLVRTISSLGIQYLRLGYSGKAGMLLAKAQSIFGTGDVQTEAVLEWHLAYAEYMLVLGNPEKCGETLAAARVLAENDPGIVAMTKPTASFSTRIKYNKLLSEASYVYALLSLKSGYSSEALTHAKQCVNLNRKIWMTVENRAARIHAGESAVTSSDVDDVTSGVANMSVQSNSTPAIMSMTHEALTGAAFWSFVPCIFRGLTQLSSVFSHQGMLQEAVYFADQASKVVAAVSSSPLIVQNFCCTARYYLESNKLDEASNCLTKAGLVAQRLPCSVDLALYHCTAGQLRQLLDEDDEALQRYDQAHGIIHSLTETHFIQQIDKLGSEEVEMTSKMSQMKIEEPPPRTRRAPAKTTKTRKTAVKAGSKTTSRSTPAAPAPAKMATECPPLQGIRGTILCRKASLLLSKDKLVEAAALIVQAEELGLGQDSAVQHHSTRFKSLMLEAMKEIAADFTFNALPESTISFPALSRPDARPSQVSLVQVPPAAVPAARKGGKGKRAAKEDFTAILQKARDCIAEVHSQAIQTSSTSAVQRVCSMLNEVTILLSATSPRGSKSTTLHPLYAAYLTELPKTNASQLEHLAISIEHQPMSRDDLLAWPSIPEAQPKPVHLTAAEFQSEYINIIPEGWTAVSLSLNEARDELYITRYAAHTSPFILRLPMARHNSRDMDEEIFGFEQGRAELREIIELSNFSMRSTPDLSKKGARTEWWAEREALDGRLGDLLANIENIWLGGFRGIFAEKKGDKTLLSQFQKSFQNILDRHLPSRQGKGKQLKATQLDSRILELFSGLGNPDDEGADLDEPLMDLIYFVVDILQFNGERNAYDEIDFDSIIIEMLDALRAFHAAAVSAPTTPQHTILILDKNLHAFPWESLPSLQSLSISRLPSMSALRERLLTARTWTQSPSKDDEPDSVQGGHHIRRSSLTGTSILNPGGDLKSTQETLSSHLQDMSGTWDLMAERTPEEKYLESSLAQKDVLLYFGHGSGAQYIRGRTVKRLYCQTHGSERRNLATSLLFGCSSAHMTENGEFEPSGMLSSYLAAGVPAVLGMLWDVTDKDCDRFAVATLRNWGLFTPDPASAEKCSRTPATRGKTPSKSRSRSKAKDKETLVEQRRERGMGLDEAVAKSRGACYLRYLNGAAGVVYGIPVFLDS